MSRSRSSTFQQWIYRKWWKVKITIVVNNKSCIGYRLAYLHLTLTYSKGQGQDHAHLDSEFLWKGERYYKITIAASYIMGFRMAYTHLTLVHFKGQDQGHTYFDICVQVIQSSLDWKYISLISGRIHNQIQLLQACSVIRIYNIYIYIYIYIYICCLLVFTCSSMNLVSWWMSDELNMWCVWSSGWINIKKD